MSGPPKRWAALTAHGGRALWLVVLAALVGAAAGALAVGVSTSAHGLQQILYGIERDQALSATRGLSPARFLALPIGGLALGLLAEEWFRRFPGGAVDPVEANALKGGRMSVRDSLFLALQSILSNGVGASVGLEAAYAQLGGVAGAFWGDRFGLSRGDVRLLVGAGAGAGIAAAFGTPLAGAFYAFEIILGAYSIPTIAPVAAAALSGSLVAQALHHHAMVVSATAVEPLSLAHALVFVGLGAACGAVGVAVMRLVTWTEAGVARLPGPTWMKPALGGVFLAGLAWISPTTLSAGHGALSIDLAASLGVTALMFLFLAKACASIISLGFGFRGGLFFASLYLGALFGKFTVLAASALGAQTGVLPETGALVGMGAMAVAIVGGPLTMTFLVLESTRNFDLAAATLTAAIVASLTVRETFGYSFSTWRLHLRGESLSGAHDVSWLRALTATGLMRADVPRVSEDLSVAAFRRQFPLALGRRVIVTDRQGRYRGIVGVAVVHAQTDAQRSVGDLAVQGQDVLSPGMSIVDILAAFQAAGVDEMAVVSDAGDVLGLLSQSWAARRYAEELDAARRDLLGET